MPGYGDPPLLAPPSQAPDLGQLQTLLLAQLIMKLQDRDGESTELSGAGRTVRKLRKQQDRMTTEPRRVVNEYLSDFMQQMGPEPGDKWQVYHHNRHIQWGRIRGLQRCHYHVGHAMALLLRGEQVQAEAYLALLLRALHQVCLDGGAWDTAALFMPAADPIDKERFGGSHAQLEVVAAYREAIKKLGKSRHDGGKDKDGKDGKHGKKKEHDDGN